MALTATHKCLIVGSVVVLFVIAVNVYSNVGSSDGDHPHHHSDEDSSSSATSHAGRIQYSRTNPPPGVPLPPNPNPPVRTSSAPITTLAPITTTTTTTTTAIPTEASTAASQDVQPSAVPASEQPVITTVAPTTTTTTTTTPAPTTTTTATPEQTTVSPQTSSDSGDPSNFAATTLSTMLSPAPKASQDDRTAVGKEAIETSHTAAGGDATTVGTAREQEEQAEQIAWQQFVARYQRVYSGHDEAARRQQIFFQNRRFIEEHNKLPNIQYKLGMNHFGDMLREEINALFIGPMLSWAQTLGKAHSQTPSLRILSDPNESETAAGIDWRNVTSPLIADQGACRESAVFAAVASIEAALNIARPDSPPVKLSETQVLDCMSRTNQAVCTGIRSLSNVFDIIQQESNSLIEAGAYKSNQHCQGDTKPTANIVGFSVVPHEHIIEALRVSGPLAVSLDASQSTFHFYSSGLYHDEKCSQEYYNQHALLIGLSPPAPKSAYLLRLSLGVNWGENGHMRMLVDETLNKCLPQNIGVFPILKSQDEL